MTQLPPKPIQSPIVHLFRGAPAVRSWSKYKTTVRDWTLCGIPRRMPRDRARPDQNATEDASLVSCAHCLCLLDPAGGKRPLADFEKIAAERRRTAAAGES